SHLSPFPVGHGGKWNGCNRSVKVNLNHTPEHDHHDEDGHDLHTEAEDKGFQHQDKQFAQFHRFHRGVDGGREGRNINGRATADCPCGAVDHALPYVKDSHRDCPGIADQKHRDPHFEEI